MNFNDRTSYLLWASEWKAAYASHSRTTHALKREFKQAQRELNWQKIHSLSHALIKAATKAREMITQRHDSKAEAQRQYLAARAVQNA